MVIIKWFIGFRSGWLWGPGTNWANSPFGAPSTRAWELIPWCHDGWSFGEGAFWAGLEKSKWWKAAIYTDLGAISKSLRSTHQRCDWTFGCGPNWDSSSTLAIPFREIQSGDLRKPMNKQERKGMWEKAKGVRKMWLLNCFSTDHRITASPQSFSHLHLDACWCLSHVHMYIYIHVCVCSKFTKLHAPWEVPSHRIMIYKDPYLLRISKGNELKANLWLPHQMIVPE